MIALTVAATVLTGCGGVERKLGRGMNNSMEIFRGGELRRSIEQAGLWDGADAAFSTGLVRGMGRTMARTAVGFSEIITAPSRPTPRIPSRRNGSATPATSFAASRSP